MCNKRLQESPEKMYIIIIIISKSAVNKSTVCVFFMLMHLQFGDYLSPSNNDGFSVKFISGQQMNVQGQY